MRWVFFFYLIFNFIVFFSVLKFPFGVILYLLFLCRDFSIFSFVSSTFVIAVEAFL